MSDDPIYDFDPYNLPAQFHQAIGLLIACAAQTEDLIDEAIAGCIGTDMEMGAAVTTHLGMPARLSILRATAEIRISDPTTLGQIRPVDRQH